MHKLEKKIIELGIIDNTLESIEVSNWFEGARITFNGNESLGIVTIEFKECFEVTLKHDRTYSKGVKADGNLDYKYFIQDVEVIESEDFLEFKISGWPLEGEIVCKEILIHTEK